MNVVIVLGYVAWGAATFALCAFILGGAAFLTMDTQNYRVWTIAVVLVLAVVTLSGYSLLELS